MPTQPPLLVWCLYTVDANKGTSVLPILTIQSAVNASRPQVNLIFGSSLEHLEFASPCQMLGIWTGARQTTLVSMDLTIRVHPASDPGGPLLSSLSASSCVLGPV